MRKFNTEGPVVAADHYCIPPLERVNLAEVLELVRDKRYFVLHAPRQTGKTSALLALHPAWYIDADGSLDVDKLLGAFQTFFRQHSEHWLGRFDYVEAGPQLLLQAFLQRVVNGGGRIEREYGLGRGRTDLLIVWPRSGRAGPEAPVNRFVIECKVLRKNPDRTVREGLEQTAGYMDRCGSPVGHLVIFDRREGRRWEDRIFRREERVDNRTIIVWRM